MLTPLVDGLPSDDDAREVMVRDISADGASLLLASPLRAQQFVLDIHSSRTGPLSILCSLRHCEKAPQAGFVVGAQFQRFLPRKETQRPPGGN
jgi:hypothetical protein